MGMNRGEKEILIQELNDTFKKNKSVLLVTFNGVNVADETELRRKIVARNGRYRVVKNRLALRAVGDTGLEPLKEQFQGPTAIAYTEGDPVVMAKVLKDFIKDHPDVAFKGGLVEGQAISANEVSSLAELPSRAELLGKLVYLLNSPITRLAAALKSPLRDLASLLRQLEERKRAD